MKKLLPLSIVATLAAIALVTAAAPIERTLGEKARFVYLHGAWVWTALALFLAAGAAGLAGLLSGRTQIQAWSQSLGRTALLLWITFLPQSLYLMQANWNGLFLDEPRFRTPLNLAVVGLLLQVGLSFFPLKYTSLANILYAGAVFFVMNGLETVLHPEAPVQNASSASIQASFYALLGLMILLALQIAWIWTGKSRYPDRGIPTTQAEA
jgi:hypothetical protein